MDAIGGTELSGFYQLGIGAGLQVSEQGLFVFVVEEEQGVEVGAVVAAGAQGGVDPGLVEAQGGLGCDCLSDRLSDLSVVFFHGRDGFLFRGRQARRFCWDESTGTAAQIHPQQDVCKPLHGLAGGGLADLFQRDGVFGLEALTLGRGLLPFFVLGARDCLFDIGIAHTGQLLEGVPEVEPVPAGEDELPGDDQSVQQVVAVYGPDEGQQSVGLFRGQGQIVGYRDQGGGVAAGRDDPEMVTQAFDEEGVVGEGEGEFSLDAVAVLVLVVEGVHRPVAGLLGILAKIHAGGREISSRRVDAEEGVGTPFDTGPGHQPGIEANHRLGGPEADGDQVEAGVGGVQGVEEAAHQVAVTGRGRLGDDGLAVADPQIPELGAIGLKRVLVRQCAGVVVGLDADHDLYRAARAQQAREGVEPTAGDSVRVVQGDDAGYQQELFLGEGFPVEIIEPGVVDRRIVDAPDLELGDAHGGKDTGELGGLVVEELGSPSAGIRVGQVLGVVALGQPVPRDAAEVDEPDQNRVRLPGLQDGEDAFDARAPFRRHLLSAFGMVHHRREDGGIEALAFGSDAVAGLARLDGFVGFAPFHVEQGAQAADGLVDLGLKPGQARDDPAADGMNQQVEGRVAAIAHDLTLTGRVPQLVQVFLEAFTVCLVQIQPMLQIQPRSPQDERGRCGSLAFPQGLAQVVFEPVQVVLEDTRLMVTGGESPHGPGEPFRQGLLQIVRVLMAVSGVGWKQEQGVVVTQLGGVAEGIEQGRQGIIRRCFEPVLRRRVAEVKVAQGEHQLPSGLGVFHRRRQGRDALRLRPEDLGALPFCG